MAALLPFVKLFPDVVTVAESTRLLRDVSDLPRDFPVDFCIMVMKKRGWALQNSAMETLCS